MENEDIKNDLFWLNSVFAPPRVENFDHRGHQ